MGYEFVNKAVSSGSDNTLKVTGIDSDDVYLLVLRLIQTQNNNEVISMRVTKSGTGVANNYHRQYQTINTAQAYYPSTNEGGTKSRIIENVDDDYGGGQSLLYLYNFNSSSEYSFWTNENVAIVSNQTLGSQGGGVHKIASASDGVEILGNSNGTFINGASAILYKVT